MAHTDPAWEYSEIWSELNQAKTELDALLGYLSTREVSSEESDHTIKQRMSLISDHMTAARGVMRRASKV